MNENNKKHENHFKFVLYLKDEPIVTRIFSADEFNPTTRYSVDIRSLLPTINYKLQKQLSTDTDLMFTRTKYGEKEYDLLEYYKGILGAQKKDSDNKLIEPEYSVQTINNKTFSGVELKYGLYINKNPIVERDFYVNKYNPASRFSENLVNTVNTICEEIYEKIRKDDIKNMWDDYFLINTFNVNSQQLREMDDEERILLLKKLKKNKK